jgi:UPF0755 protein
LDPENNNFIYFCASVERFWIPEFAATLEEHNKKTQKKIFID